MDLNVKFISEFNHSFTNHGFLYTAILKALYDFKEKEPSSQEICNFFPQNVQNEIFKILKMLENDTELTREAF